MLDSLDKLEELLSSSIIEISTLDQLVDALDNELEDLEDPADIDVNWATSFKCFYKKVSCYRATILVSEFHIVDYFMEFACDLVKECPEAVRPFIDVRALAQSMSGDLTVFEIKYPSGPLNSESWYLV